MKPNKALRLKVWGKYDNRCAYCGVELLYDKLQVDHIEPHWHTVSEEQAVKSGINKGSHSIDNLNPSCARCNKWKSTFSIEDFRREIQLQCERLSRDRSAYRMAINYGLIKETGKTVQFHFESFKP